MSATVTVDREELRELLVEAFLVDAVFEQLAGHPDSPLTVDLGRKASALCAALGPTCDDDGRVTGALVDSWEEGRRRAGDWLRELAAEAVAS